MRRKITLAFLILAAFLLQTTVFQYFQIASVTPNLLLILRPPLVDARKKRGTDGRIFQRSDD